MIFANIWVSKEKINHKERRYLVHIQHALFYVLCWFFPSQNYVMHAAGNDILRKFSWYPTNSLVVLLEF